MHNGDDELGAAASNGDDELRGASAQDNEIDAFNEILSSAFGEGVEFKEV